jgi:hypothetical protein
MFDREPDEIDIGDDLTELALEELQKRRDDLLRKGAQYDPKTGRYYLDGKYYDDDANPI